MKKTWTPPNPNHLFEDCQALLCALMTFSGSFCFLIRRSKKVIKFLSLVILTKINMWSSQLRDQDINSLENTLQFILCNHLSYCHNLIKKTIKQSSFCSVTEDTYGRISNDFQPVLLRYDFNNLHFSIIRKLCRFIFWHCVVINRILNNLKSLHLRVLFDNWICFNKFVYILTEQYEHAFLYFNGIFLFYRHKW